MRRYVAFVGAVLIIIACAKAEQKTVDSGMPGSMMPKPLTLGELAGTWSVRAMNEAGDSTLLTYDLVATNDTTPWKVLFPNRQPISIRILSIAGDSVVTEMGPYESALRKGVQVTTHMVSRLMDGKLVGQFVAHYSTTGADSVLRGRTEGTKKP